MMKTINEVQDHIVENFLLFGEERDLALEHLMELGCKLPVMPLEHKTDDYLVQGCTSKVWLFPIFVDGKVIFEADSNTGITKGLISLLISLWNGRTPDEILSTELYFIDKIGLSGMITSQRSNGFASMIKQMKMYALAFKTK